MKFTSQLFSLGLAATSALATPLSTRQDDGLDLFQLQISSPSMELDGRFLAMSGNELGIFEGDDTSPVRVYQTDGQKAGCKELHTYPVGFVDHSLGLVGDSETPGFLQFVDLVNPGGKPTDDSVALWDTFRVSDDGRLTNDGEGSWLAFPGEDEGAWTVRWSDGSAMMTQNYLPIEVMYKSAGEGRYNGE
ncbi:hypothetical protein F4780DRAFT_563585 [Xylariomycetidae sp. FL0641]|nr:hypothetical protein F4780DRAFT_563585 [Xylariomycetidae sp. FL0641]